MKLKDIRTTCGETLKVDNQWAAECQARDTTISSSSWTYGGTAVSGGSVTGTKTTITFSPDTGYGCLRNTVLLANGETLVGERAVVMNEQPMRDYV